MLPIFVDVICLCGWEYFVLAGAGRVDEKLWCLGGGDLMGKHQTPTQAGRWAPPERMSLGWSYVMVT